jgi:putative membrane protein
MSRYANLPVVALIFCVAFYGTSAGQSPEQLPLDSQFLVKAVDAGNAEILFSELADSHSSTNDVKAFAKRIIKDHQDLNKQLKNYASDQKIAIVAGTDKQVRDEVDALSRLKNAQFDTAYVNRMVDDHQKAVQLFENQERQGKDSQLKAYANMALPTLRKHHADAKALAAQLKK